MINELRSFYDKRYGKICAIQICGETWFVGVEVAKALGFVDPNGTIYTKIADEDKKRLLRGDISNPDKKEIFPRPGMIIINENGLYTLIMQSKLPGKGNFTRWITSVVMPQMAKEEAENEQESRSLIEEIAEILTNPDKLEELAKEIRKKQEMKPTASAEESKSLCGTMIHKNRIPVTDIGYEYGISAKKLNVILEDMGIQHREGSVWHLNDEYNNCGYAEIIPLIYDDRHTTDRLYWTPKGRNFIHKKMEERGYRSIQGRSFFEN